jgi:hypothetical protein
MIRAIAALLLVLAMPLGAQKRDFLTAEEADKIRQAQDPNLRLPLYVTFAKDRLAQINQLISRDRAGRSALLHDLLEDYTKIIEAIDTVAEDALRRKVDIAKGMAVVLPAEQDLLAALKKVDQVQLADKSRYAFVLDDAIAATKDSIELSKEDLGDRLKEVSAKQQKEEAARQADLTPEEAKQRQEAKAKDEKQKKAPTLRRPGDPPPRIGTK